MENMENSTANASGRRATMFGNEIASDTSHLKTEVVLLQRKYERLQQKERRMQVFRINSWNIHCFSNITVIICKEYCFIYYYILHLLWQEYQNTKTCLAYSIQTLLSHWPKKWKISKCDNCQGKQCWFQIKAKW